MTIQRITWPACRAHWESLGTDGDFQFSYAPGMVTGDYVSVEASSGGSCGGAHPDGSEWHITFDRQTGRKVDLFGWFTRAGFVPSSPGDAGTIRQITPALRRLVASRFHFDQDECREPVETADFWDISIDHGGMIFQPSLPHVVAACSDGVVVPFAVLNPYLSPSGKQGAARLAGR